MPLAFFSEFLTDRGGYLLAASYSSWTRSFRSMFIITFLWFARSVGFPTFRSSFLSSVRATSSWKCWDLLFFVIRLFFWHFHKLLKKKKRKENGEHLNILVYYFWKQTRCRSRWENLDRGQYRFRLIEFLNKFGSAQFLWDTAI